jgi:hypothetical protein
MRLRLVLQVNLHYTNASKHMLVRTHPGVKTPSLKYLCLRNLSCCVTYCSEISEQKITDVILI